MTDIKRLVQDSAPIDHDLTGHGWTLKKLQQWVARYLDQTVSRSSLRTLLRRVGLSWKKCKK